MESSPCDCVHTTEMDCVYVSVNIRDKAEPLKGLWTERPGPSASALPGAATLARVRQRRSQAGALARARAWRRLRRDGDTTRCDRGEGGRAGISMARVGGRAGDSASLHETLARLGQDMIQCNGLDCCTTQRYKSTERVSKVWNRVRAPSSTGIFGKATN